MGSFVFPFWKPYSPPFSNPSRNIKVSRVTGSLVERTGGPRWPPLGVVETGGSLQKRKRFFLGFPRGGGLTGVDLVGHLTGESRWGNHLVTSGGSTSSGNFSLFFLRRLHGLLQRVHV